MSIAIALLSGKGGSGKTTLALSIADLLCRCDVQTLLVDCDLYTNGATYFYESQLLECKNKQPQLYSLKNLLNSNICANNISPLRISPKLDFISSVPEISKRYLTDDAIWHRDSAIRLQELLDWARQSYDVILFDCQAGYTELLPTLLPQMDGDLFVLEADSVSASALRSLHLKIENFLGDAQLYQVFNKATSAEFHTYSKIKGTFYKNIGTLLFDRKIREAFSNSQTPNVDNTSAKYCLDLCNICKNIFLREDIHEKLDIFSGRLLYQQLEEDLRRMETILYTRTTKTRRFYKFFIETVIWIVSLLLPLLIGVMEGGLFSLKSNSMLIAITFMLVVFVHQAFTVTSTFRKSRDTRRKYEQKMKDLNKELKKLDRLWKDHTIVKQPVDYN